MKGTLESFRQQWKKEVGLQNEMSSEENENATTKEDDGLNNDNEENENQSPESDLEKRVCIIFCTIYFDFLITMYYHMRALILDNECINNMLI